MDLLDIPAGKGATVGKKETFIPSVRDCSKSIGVGVGWSREGVGHHFLSPWN